MSRNYEQITKKRLETLAAKTPERKLLESRRKSEAQKRYMATEPVEKRRKRIAKMLATRAKNAADGHPVRYRAHNCKPVKVFQDGEYLGTYPTTTEASKVTGITVTKIGAALGRTLDGFTFEEG